MVNPPRQVEPGRPPSHCSFRLMFPLLHSLGGVPILLGLALQRLRSVDAVPRRKRCFTARLPQSVPCSACFHGTRRWCPNGSRCQLGIPPKMAFFGTFLYTNKPISCSFGVFKAWCPVDVSQTNQLMGRTERRNPHRTNGSPRSSLSSCRASEFFVDFARGFSTA